MRRIAKRELAALRYAHEQDMLRLWGALRKVYTARAEAQRRRQDPLKIVVVVDSYMVQAARDGKLAREDLQEFAAILASKSIKAAIMGLDSATLKF